MTKELSNSNTDIDVIVEMCCKLGRLWKESSLQVCQKLQNLVFPDGILWDKRKGSYRTIKTNKALELIAEISSNYKKSKRGHTTLVSRLVRMGGLEPPLREELDPKSSAATNYATSAYRFFLPDCLVVMLDNQSENRLQRYDFYLIIL